MGVGDDPGFPHRLVHLLRTRTVSDEFLSIRRMPSPGLRAQCVVNCCSSNCMTRGGDGPTAERAQRETHIV